MRLFPEVIANFATGCQGWEWHEDVLRLERMPKIMQPIYEEPEGAKVRMQCTSGVRLRFVSDTTRLHIELAFGVWARPIFKCDLFVDGKRVCETGVGPDEFTERWDGVIYENNHAKERVFDLWLPHTSQADVVEMQVDDDCFIEPAESLPVRWLMYGDSISQGMVSQLPTTSAFGIAALATNAEVFNLAIGGAKCDARLATTVPEGHFDLISIAYGANDFNGSYSLDGYAANTKALLENLLEKFPQTPILLITPLHWVASPSRVMRPEANDNGDTLDAFRDALKPLANINERITLIDGLTLVPKDEDMFVDNVHPNDKGFAIYGKLLAEHASKAIGL